MPDSAHRRGAVPPAARSRSALRILRPLGFVLLVVVAAGAPRLAGAAPEAVSRAQLSATAVVAAGEADAAGTELGYPQAVLLGVVEGVTEFLPVSSTGHLLVTERLLDIGTDDSTKEAADAYAVVIQAGAILAVAFLYWRRIVSVLRGLVGRDDEGRRLLIALVLAFVPAAVVGLAFESEIKDRLFGAWPVVAAWAVGGVALLAVSSRGWIDRARHAAPLETITARQALLIGVAQCLALWPGTSRSLVTIVAALLVGLGLEAAVEFSFLLGLVTLGAATALDAAKSGDVIVSAFGVGPPVVGFVAAFLAALVAVRWMVGYLQRHSLAIFGWYRLGVAAVVAVLLVSGVIVN